MTSRFFESWGIIWWLTAAILFFSIASVEANVNLRKVGNAGVLFLNISNSPRANGMGGCMLNVIDEESPFFNPGAPGLFHMQRIFSISLPHKTDWLPGLEADMSYETSTISAGAHTGLFAPEIYPRLSIGFGYGKRRFDHGPVPIVDYQGTYRGMADPWDEAKYYSLGIGIEYYARLGIGITKKEIVSNLPNVGMGSDPLLISTEADAIDFGLIVQFPVADILARTTHLNQSKQQNFGFALTPSFAYVYSNSGDGIEYEDTADPLPLPEQKKIGIGAYGAVTYDGISLASQQILWERHRWQIGPPSKTHQLGIELGVLDAAFIRFGSYSDASGDTSYDTFGFGVSFHGFLNILRLSGIEQNSDIIDYLLSHVDFTYDYASYSGDDTPLDEATFTSVCLSF